MTSSQLRADVSPMPVEGKIPVAPCGPHLRKPAQAPVVCVAPAARPERPEMMVMRMQLELKTRGFDDGPSKDAGRRTREHCGGIPARHQAAGHRYDGQLDAFEAWHRLLNGYHCSRGATLWSPADAQAGFP